MLQEKPDEWGKCGWLLKLCLWNSGWNGICSLYINLKIILKSLRKFKRGKDSEIWEFNTSMLKRWEKSHKKSHPTPQKWRETSAPGEGGWVLNISDSSGITQLVLLFIVSAYQNAPFFQVQETGPDQKNHILSDHQWVPACTTSITFSLFIVPVFY